MSDVDVLVTEVGARDGLQNEDTVLEPAVRAELVRRLVGTGVPGSRRCRSSTPAGCRRWPAPS